MSNNKVGTKGLIGFLLTVFVVVVVGVAGGIYLIVNFLPKENSAPEPIVENVKEQVSKKETKEEKSSPNTTILSSDIKVRLRCGGEDFDAQKKHELYIKNQKKCIVHLGESKSNQTFYPNKSYTCLLLDTKVSCMDEENYKEHLAQLEKKEAKVPSPSTGKRATKTKKKTTTARPRTDLKNEADVTVTGPGTITIASDIQAMIYIDGKSYRKSPLYKQKIKAGKHNVTIVPVSDPARQKKFRVEVKSGVGYMFKWSFEEGRWLQKRP